METEEARQADSPRASALPDNLEEVSAQVRIVHRASDDELLRLMREVETQENFVDAVSVDEPEAKGDACICCGEIAENVGECHVCRESGCLPPDVWTPGMGEPCLTVCVRCARTVHATCAIEDEAGNPRCPSCHY